MRVLIFNVFFYGYTFCVAGTCWVLARTSTQAAMHRVLRHWGRTMRRAVELLLGARIEVRGWERLPEGGALIAAKHQSELDVVLLGELMPHTGAVAMQELTRYPFFGPILERLDLVLVAVDQGPQGRTQQVVEGARRIRAQGRPLIVYPEGELMKLGARERYRKGIGHIYTTLGEPVYPVAKSLGVIWPQRRWRKNTGVTGAMEVLEPIPPGLPLEAFMEELERRIEEGSMRLIREHAPEAERAAAERRHAAGVNNHTEPA
jgi:1-acyl-sn-glycerol-3-phosphate acyltransferase